MPCLEKLYIFKIVIFGNRVGLANTIFKNTIFKAGHHPPLQNKIGAYPHIYPNKNNILKYPKYLPEEATGSSHCPSSNKLNPIQCNFLIHPKIISGWHESGCDPLSTECVYCVRWIQLFHSLLAPLNPRTEHPHSIKTAFHHRE